jgi:L-aminoadipate-semialdehyde dehydrogenase
VRLQEHEFTYGWVDATANRLAHLLGANGVRQGEVVAIYGHRSPPVVIAIIGIIRAGCAYTMIDPVYPTDRIEGCVGIAAPTGWVAVGAAGQPPPDLQKFLDEYGFACRVTLPDCDTAAFAELLAAQPATPPVGVRIEKDSTVVITFTSGSTGLPKGVMGRHSSLTWYYPWMGETFGLSESDRSRRRGRANRRAFSPTRNRACVNRIAIADRRPLSHRRCRHRFSMCSGIAHDPLQRDIFTPLFFGAAVCVAAWSRMPPGHPPTSTQVTRARERRHIGLQVCADARGRGSGKTACTLSRAPRTHACAHARSLGIAHAAARPNSGQIVRIGRLPMHAQPSASPHFLPQL